MSTCGWYEYHVLDSVTRRHSLAMQFYKWGDATPEQAFDEWRLLQDQIDEADGLLPVVWLDNLLREQLGVLYDRLPPFFTQAAFLFLIQRAEEECRPYRNWEYRDLPKEERPDYRLGFAVGKAMVLNRFQPQSHPNARLNRVLAFIAAGHFVRPWREYGLTWSVLQWLQYLTQVTQRTEMGSLAGEWRRAPWDINYLYRFFIWIDSAQTFKITRLSLELCDRSGNDLFASLAGRAGKNAEQVEYDRQEAARWLECLKTDGVDMFSLEQVKTAFETVPDRFWGTQGYERPPVPRAERAAE